jgi:phosphate transport system permease protein
MMKVADPGPVPLSRVDGAVNRAIDRRRAVDAGARWVVSAGGLATIGSIIAILGFIALEVYPLWRPARADPRSAFQIGATENVLAPFTDEYRENLGFFTTDGQARFVRLTDGKLTQELPVPGVDGRRIDGAARAAGGHVLLTTEDGRLLGIHAKFETRHLEDGGRELHPTLTRTGEWSVTGNGSRIHLLDASAPTDGSVTALFSTESEPLSLVSVRQTENFLGEVQRQEVRRPLPVAAGQGRPLSIAVNAEGTSAYVGWTGGMLQLWDLTDPENPQPRAVAGAARGHGVGITALEFLIGERSVVVGDGSGNVSVWFPVRDEAAESGWRLQQAHELDAHAGAVTAIAASPRDRGFLTADDTGNVRLRHATTARTLLDLPSAAGPVRALLFAPRADGSVAIDASNKLIHSAIANPHPEISLRTLFGKVLYEGYPEPAHVWQSTGGSDSFEPKLGLVPLLVGTMKGTLYALLFAVPLAVLAAVYTSQFSSAGVRGVVKPTVEIMAALPSVVLGFLAGLWLAPVIEDVVPAMLTALAVLPALIVLASVAWQSMPKPLRRWAKPGSELLLMAILIVLGVQICLWANPVVEAVFFGGDFRNWLYESGGRFDQRNCIVVGFAMGFAVIPVIFTISEDALSNVPQRLTSASLALGATPWQTALRVVLPTASPGIFSAVMIGFGRAVGETMIVLMATGNTPVLDWSIFTGMRTLSANIAVEIPEAPYGGTLYRVLFLTALLLFFATFILNTLAEVVRQRLRRRFQML